MATSNQLCSAISVRLDDKNYPTWHFLMQHYLRGLGLLKFVDGSYSCPPQFQRGDYDSLSVENTEAYEKWLQQDSYVICLITASLSADALTLVIGCQTSMEVWLTLKQRYATVSEFHIMQLKSNLQAIRKGSDCIDKYLLRFKHVRNQLAVIGVSMSDEDIKPLILAGLPSEYAHTRQIIRSKNFITMEEVRCLLLSAEFEFEAEHKARHLSPFTSLIAHNGVSNPTHQNMQFGLPNPIAQAHELLSSPYLSNCVVSAPIHHDVNMVPGVSSVHHYNTSPTASTTHFGYALPQKSMSSSLGFAIPNVPANCHSSYNTGILSPTSSAPSAPNPRYVLNNGIGNDILAGTFSQTPQVAGKPEYFSDGQIRRKEIKSELPRLDKFLVEEMTKLEKEVQETKNRRNDSKEQTVGNSNRIVDENANSDKSKLTSETILGLGTIILKHGSKFEKQIEEAKEKSRGDCETPRKNSERNKTSSETIHSLESMLIKHSSKLDKEFEEAKKNSAGTSAIDLNKNAAENMKKNASATETNKKAGTKGAQGSLDKIMLNNVHTLEREKMQALAKENNYEFRTVDKKKGGNNVTLKEIDTLLRQGTWQLPCTPHERPLLNCRQAYCSMELCQALPLIPPG